MKGLPFGRRFGFALQGLRQAVRGERSLRSHLLATAAVLLLLLLTRPAARGDLVGRAVAGRWPGTGG